MERFEDLVEIQGGQSFRGSVCAVESGNALVVQMRDITPEGGIEWGTVVRTQLQARMPRWLRVDDVLLTAKGNHHRAVYVGNPPAPCVGAQCFFVLRSRTPRLLPEFLAWQLNRAPAQAHFARHAEGSGQRSIRREVLQSLTLALPTVPQQLAVVEVARKVEKERSHYAALMRNRQEQLDALAFDLLRPRGG